MQSVRSIWYMYISTVAARCLNRENRFLVFSSSLFVLAVNSVGSWFNYISEAASYLKTFT